MFLIKLVTQADTWVFLSSQTPRALYHDPVMASDGFMYSLQDNISPVRHGNRSGTSLNCTQCVQCMLVPGNISCSINTRIDRCTGSGFCMYSKLLTDSPDQLIPVNPIQCVTNTHTQTHFHSCRLFQMTMSNDLRSITALPHRLCSVCVL